MYARSDARQVLPEVYLVFVSVVGITECQLANLVSKGRLRVLSRLK